MNFFPSSSEIGWYNDGSLRIGWKETDCVPSRKSFWQSRVEKFGAAEALSFYSPLRLALHTFSLLAPENYDLREIKLHCPNWSLLIWSITEVSPAFFSFGRLTWESLPQNVIRFYISNLFFHYAWLAISRRRENNDLPRNIVFSWEKSQLSHVWDQFVKIFQRSKWFSSYWLSTLLPSL